MSFAWAAYRVLAPCIGALAPAAWIFASPQERSLWDERLGRVRIEGGCDAWIHAASMGEARAVAPLTEELTALQPAASFHLTATTRTGRKRLREIGVPATLAPIDSPQAIDTFVRGVRPRRLLLLETELWPHWLLRMRADRVPVAVVSARLSERSRRRYRGLGSDLRRLIGELGAVLCQTEVDRGRWIDLGAVPDRTTVVGNLKDDALPRPTTSRSTARAELELDRERPLLVLGSVRPGELRPLARAWMGLPDALRARWQVVVVPRHARATRELLEDLEGVGPPVVAAGVPRDGGWRWDDRPGVLNGYYAAAEAAFVGGSLAPYGGHNPIEPAACGAAVIMGPHHATQSDAVEALRAAGAIEIAGSEPELAAALLRLLGDDAEREARAAAARAVAESRRGAARRAVRRLVELDLWPPA